MKWRWQTEKPWEEKVFNVHFNNIQVRNHVKCGHMAVIKQKSLPYELTFLQGRQSRKKIRWFYGSIGRWMLWKKMKWGAEPNLLRVSFIIGRCSSEEEVLVIPDFSPLYHLLISIWRVHLRCLVLCPALWGTLLRPCIAAHVDKGNWSCFSHGLADPQGAAVRWKEPAFTIKFHQMMWAAVSSYQKHNCHSFQIIQ